MYIYIFERYTILFYCHLPNKFRVLTWEFRMFLYETMNQLLHMLASTKSVREQISAEVRPYNKLINFSSYNNLCFLLNQL